MGADEINSRRFQTGVATVVVFFCVAEFVSADELWEIVIAEDVFAAKLSASGI